MLLRKVESRIRKYLEFLDDRKYQTIGYPFFSVAETDREYRTVPEDLEWKSIELPYRYGQEWSSFWFETSLQLPPEAEGAQVFFEARPHSDCLVFINREPVGALNTHHNKIRLSGCGQSGREYIIHIEAYGGHKFPGCHPFEKDRVFLAIKDSVPEYPNTFSDSRICIKNEEVYRLYYDVRTLFNLALTLEDDSLRRNRILSQLYKNLMKIHFTAGDDEFFSQIREASSGIQPLLSCINGSTSPRVHAVGHAHLDHAWLWPKSETIRKAARTFSNMCRYMEEFPEFVFLQSQPCQLELIANEYPTIFRKIQKAYAKGQWEPNGGMWVEADCNIPGGEALVRQFLVGKKASRKLLNYEGDTLWLPDVFGYSAALPQILKKCEIEYFVTSKINWNDTTRFPYDTFLWKGINGTGIKTTYLHISYNGIMEPERLDKTWKAVQHKEIQDSVLMSVGEGDGGGGTHRSDLEMARRMANLEGCPRVSWSKVSDGLKEIFTTPDELPHWQGELYLELHRGTYTNQSRLKRYNRRLEFKLRELEALAVMKLLEKNAKETFNYPFKPLEDAWKILLTNQFHDIIPGSSIRKVNLEAEEEYWGLEQDLNRLEARILNCYRELESSEVKVSSIEVYNTLSWSRNSRIALPELENHSEPLALSDGENVYPLQRDISFDRDVLLCGFPKAPSLGGIAYSINPLPKPAEIPFHLDNRDLETPYYHIKLDRLGRIISLKDKAGEKEFVSPGQALNTLLSAEDVPVYWDAWDIDEDYRLKMSKEERLLEWSVVSTGPCLIKIRSRFEIGQNSELLQDMILYSHHRRIDFETRVEWKESHKLLKVSFPLNIHSQTAKCEIQYGYVTRNTHENLPSDRAQFEVCAHKWVCLEEGNYGAALLNDCKYGHDISENSLNLTLLKSSKAPDPESDMGQHTFCYSILPFCDGFSAETVIRPAYDLNQPLTVTETSSNEIPEQGFSLAEVDNPAVIVESIKKSEDNKSFIFRLYEAEGMEQLAAITFNRPIHKAEETNMLERAGQPLSCQENTLSLRFDRFEIKTLKMEFI